MSTEWTPANELAELIDTLCCGEITKQQAAKLEQLVLTDVSARRYYVRYLHLHASLPQFLLPDEERFNPVEVNCGPGLIDQCGSSRQTADQHDHPPAAPIIVITASSPPVSGWSLLSTPLGSCLFSYFVATVVLSTTMLIGSWCRLSLIPVAQQSVPTAEPSSATPSFEAKPVGRITGMADCVWDGPEIRGQRSGNNGLQSKFPSPASRSGTGGEGGLRLHSPIHPNDRFALRSGLLEITYDSGAKVLLQGPVTYKVDSAAGGYLSIGRLTARLEKKNLPSPEKRERAGSEESVGSEEGTKYGVRSTGKVANASSSIQHSSSSPQPLAPSPSPSPDSGPLFTVTTPTAIITDLGTEFGVEVNGAGATVSEVFVGKVGVVSLQEQKNRQTSSHTVVAGWVVHVDATGVRVASAGDFSRTNWQRSTRKTTPRPSRYAETVSQMGPAVYYRMERPANAGDYNHIFDSSPSHCHGAVHLGDEFGVPWLHGRVGTALAMRGAEAGDYAIVPDYPKTTNGELSVSAWVMAERRSSCVAIIAANWLCKVHGQFHLGLSEDGDLAAVATDASGNRIVAREGLNKPFPLNQWQHVACVADGSTLRLYHNGQQVASTACRGIKASPPVSTLTIGFKDDDDSPANVAPRRRYFWCGRIDELAIFNRALSEQEIARLNGDAERE